MDDLYSTFTLPTQVRFKLCRYHHQEYKNTLKVNKKQILNPEKRIILEKLHYILTISILSYIIYSNWKELQVLVIML